MLARSPFQSLIATVAIVDPSYVAAAAVLDPLHLPLIALGPHVREATLRVAALNALRLTLVALVLSGGAALNVAPLRALAIIAMTLGTHGLAFGGANALDLTLAPTALSPGKTALAATATLDALRLTASAALGPDLTASAATLRLDLPATGALDLSLTFSAAVPVGLGCCRRGDRKCRDTGREDEVPHLESPIRSRVTTTLGERRSTFR